MEQKRQSRLVTMAVLITAVGMAYLTFDFYLASQTGSVKSVEETREIVRALGGTEEMLPVVMFGTSWCPACRAAKKFFQDENIEYVSGDIEQDRTAARLYLQVTGGRQLGIPQIIIGDQVFAGYSPWRMKQAIAKLKDRH